MLNLGEEGLGRWSSSECTLGGQWCLLRACHGWNLPGGDPRFSTPAASLRGSPEEARVSSSVKGEQCYSSTHHPQMACSEMAGLTGTLFSHLDACGSSQVLGKNPHEQLHRRPTDRGYRWSVTAILYPSHSVTNRSNS